MSSDYKRDRIAQDVKDLQRKISDLEYDKTRLGRTEQVEIEKVKSEFRTRRTRLETEQANINSEVILKKKELDRIDREYEAANPSTLTPSEKARAERKERQRLY